jgi:hypothetical protein
MGSASITLQEGTRMDWRLRFPDDTSLRLPLGATRLGRESDCAVQIIDPTVSRHHAMVVVGEASVAVADLGSRNGTWVDEARVDGPVELHQPARLRVGRVDLALEFAPPGVHDEARWPRRLPPEPSSSIETPSLVLGRRQWFLEAQADLLRGALARGSLEEADAALANVADEPDLGRVVSLEAWAQLLRGALSLAVAGDSGRWIGWLFVQLATSDAPPPAFVRELQALPASLCVRALDDLEAMLASWRTRGPALSADARASMPRFTALAIEARELVEQSLAATDQRIRIELPPSRL